MTKISSNWTFFYKKVFPLLLFGGMAFALFGHGFPDELVGEDLMFLIGPAIAIGIAALVMKKTVWDLADEVHDAGEFLLVKYRGEEERLPLSNVMNVSVSTAMNPPRITLRLVNPGKFGEEIAFSPVADFTINPFAKNRVAEDLMVRVDRARSKRPR